MKRIGIYGGTFNPPHVGHIRAAQYALTALNLDKLLIIPSCIAPHKQLPEDSATPSQRLRMLQLCFGHTEKIVISDLELQRGGTSYTYETVQQIKTCYPEDELVLFMGTDMFLSFLNWRKPEVILQRVSIGVFYRGQRGENTAVDQQKALLEEMDAKVYIVDNPVTEIASTDLRRLLHFDCAQDFLPAGVHKPWAVLFS